MVNTRTAKGTQLTLSTLPFLQFAQLIHGKDNTAALADLISQNDLHISCPPVYALAHTYNCGVDLPSLEAAVQEYCSNSIYQTQPAGKRQSVEFYYITSPHSSHIWLSNFLYQSIHAYLSVVRHL